MEHLNNGTYQLGLTFDLLKFVLLGLFGLGVYLLLVVNRRNKIWANRDNTGANVLIAASLLAILNLYVQRFSNIGFPDIGLFNALLLGPAFWVFVKSILEPNLLVKRILLWHLMPAFMMLLFLLFSQAVFTFSTTLFSCLHFGAYFLLSVWILGSKKDTNTNRKEKKELWHLTMATFLIYMAILVEAFFFEPKYTIRYALLIVFLAFLYLIVRHLIIGAVNIFYFYKHEKNKPPVDIQKKYEKSPLTKESSVILARELARIMQAQKLFLDESLNLNNLSERMDTSPRYLSQAINEHFNCNFFTYTNNYRIAEAKKMLLSDDYRDHKIYEIMHAVGFNSRSSFISAFKKNTGLTPKEFKNKHLNK